MATEIRAGFKLEHAPGVFTEILFARISPEPDEAGLWEVCVDSSVFFSPKQISRQIFTVYGGVTEIPVMVVEAGVWESRVNRTKILVRLVGDAGDAAPAAGVVNTSGV
jgi:hypothetical protein